MDRPAVVVDNGTATCKAGFANENEPRTEILTVVGRPKRFPNVMPQVKEFYMGNDALSKRGILMIRYPIQQGAITDWDNIEKVWHHLLHTEVEIPLEESPVLMTASSANCTTSSKEKMAEIMFEKFKVPSFQVEDQAVLALFHSGKTTGVVVDSGHGCTHIVPIHDGIALGDQRKKFRVNGGDLSVFLKTMLQDKGYSLDDYSTNIQNDINTMKEKLCYTALDFESEMKPAAESSINNHKTFQLADGNIIALGNELFRCAEIMFQPSCLGQEDQGIHKHLFDSVMSCDTDIQKELFRNIVLARGNTLFKGMPERLRAELKELAPPFTEIIVEAPTDRRHSVWIGGSILASLPSFRKMWISKKDYDDIGPAACHRKSQEL